MDILSTVLVGFVAGVIARIFFTPGNKYKSQRFKQCTRGPYIVLAVAGLYLIPTFAMAQSSLNELRACLDVEDQTKERLDCYDEKIKPAPKQVSAPAKTVEDCRFLKEEDERLNCFNGFVKTPPKKNSTQQKSKKPMVGTMAPSRANQ